MDEAILDILSTYGVETVVIALFINLLTNFLKLPIKAYSKRSGKNANKYISLIPVILGFAGAFAYKGLTAGWANVNIDDAVALAVSSASLSLAMFAIIEKFLPKKKADASVKAEAADGTAAETAATESDADTLDIIAEAATVIEKLKRFKGSAGKAAEGGAAKNAVSAEQARAVASSNVPNGDTGNAEPKAAEAPANASVREAGARPFAGGKIILGHRRGAEAGDDNKESA